MVIAGLLHWLVSQSIFLVSIETLIFDITIDHGVATHYRNAIEYDYNHDIPNVLTCGYSLYPIVFVLAIGGVMLVTLVFVASLRSKGAMPVVSSNTIAIAAACHLEDDLTKQEDISLQQLQWGVTSHPDHENSVGHCSFSNKEVRMPRMLALYA
jgi:hypothetical protein